MKRFSIVENGYDIDEVNRFIDIVISRLEKLNTENATLVAKIEKLNQRQNVPVSDESNTEISAPFALIIIVESSYKLVYFVLVQ